MNKIKAILIDDEPRARALMQGLLAEYCPQVEVLADCGDLPNGVKAIRRHRPELVFLDIEMPGHSGLELLEFFEEEDITFSIIFTTAYAEYALQALKMAAVDYLLKPVEPAELQAAVERHLRRTSPPSYQALRQALAPQHPMRIAVPTSAGMRFLLPAEIQYLKADNTYTEITLVSGDRLLVSRTLKNFEEALEGEATFFRCHKSYIVNLASVQEYSRSDGGFLLMKDGMQVAISPDRTAEFLEKMRIVKR